MKSDKDSDIPAGWVGGFAESNPAFAYPNPDLTSLPMLDNMDNIDLLQRQQAVLWPEFSWETRKDEADTRRCFQMFAPDISRLGYTDEGRVYSIICPQQGACSTVLGCMNVEVTVTGNRGWANETNRTLAADMSVVGKIWFSPSTLKKHKLVREARKKFADKGLKFPFDKANAIVVTTHLPGNPDQVIFPLNAGQTKEFEVPDFAKHEDEAWTVGNLSVEIGPIEKTGHEIVDDFNQAVLDLFNLASGNMLQNGNVLTWNVWFTEPSLVNVVEWRTHALRWRLSIDADHGSPDGEGTSAKYFDGKPFRPVVNALEGLFDFGKLLERL
mgnify:CR=1 FL=1